MAGIAAANVAMAVIFMLLSACEFRRREAGSISPGFPPTNPGAFESFSRKTQDTI